jgi:Fe-S oxidoreductase
VAENISKTHNHFSLPHENRLKWVTSDLKPSKKADIVYFVGCASSYHNPEIARATAKVITSSGNEFMLLPDEWCCGNVPYSVGMVDEAKEIAKRNINAVKETGAKILLTSCAECYRMWKADYPKILNIATADLGFKVIHLLEFADDALKNGSLKIKKPIDMRITYHDSCGVSRLCDAWTPWKGERGWMGTVSPPLKRRRGREGLYSQPRNIINSIPGVDFVEMPRIRENAFCCGAGRGTKVAFPQLASFSAKHRLEEVKEIGAELLVSSCPWCKNNFTQAIRDEGNKIKVMDISELILSSIEA